MVTVSLVVNSINIESDDVMTGVLTIVARCLGASQTPAKCQRPRAYRDRPLINNHFIRSFVFPGLLKTLIEIGMIKAIVLL